MTTTAAAPGAVRAWDSRSDRKAYLVWIACVWAAIVAGFGLDFGRYLGEAPAPPFILHVHGAIYVVWLSLVTTQILLVEGGRVRLHKTLGWWVAGLSLVMVPLGLVAAMVDKARVFGRPDADLQFLSLEFEEMFAFSTFMIAGLLWRKDMAAHKRLMILTAVSISDAGFARLWQSTIKVAPPGPFGWWLQYFWGIALLVIAMAGWDLWRRRRIHPAVLFGAVVLLGGEIAATALYFTPAWATAMTALVQAWGWKG
jgi:hypothetical protein